MRSATKGPQANTSIPSNVRITCCPPSSAPETGSNRLHEQATTPRSTRPTAFVTLENARAVRQTEKALLVEHTKLSIRRVGDKDVLGKTTYQLWVPKSVILASCDVQAAGDVGQLTIPDWVLNRRARIHTVRRDEGDARTRGDRYREAFESAREAGLSAEEAHEEAKASVS